MLTTDMAPWPCFSSEEADAAARVISSNRVNYWTGTECRVFESEYAAWVDARHAIALANGTVAIDLALRGLGIGPGDDVIVTPRTFIASVSAVVNAGARPVFADVDRDSGNITAETIARVVTPATKAIIPVHLAGWPCDMTAIMDMAAAHGLSVIEDCAQAHGARHAGRSVGSIGDVGAWSFCQDKIITTGGEGGMVTTSDEALWSRMWSFKDHGKSFDAVYNREHPPGFRWLHETIGTNWRMLEVQGAIGRIQLRKMDSWTAQRTANAHALVDVLKDFPSVRVPLCAPRDVHAFYRLYAYVRLEMLAEGWSRDRIIAELNTLGTPVYQGSCSEVYLERAFDATTSRPDERLPVAKELGGTSLMFLTHPSLTEADIDRMRETLAIILTKATR
jgi:dTDP-4-amino-4,6-dideoxygalactose transaminase